MAGTGDLMDRDIETSYENSQQDAYVAALQLAVEGLANLVRQEWKSTRVEAPNFLSYAVDTWAFGTLTDHDPHVEALRKLESGAFPEQGEWRP